jgi:hypothetical protein
MAMIRRSRDRGAVSGHAELVRRVLRTERGLKGYRPEPRPWSTDPPPAPRFAEDVITAVASVYPPGSAVGLQNVIDLIDVPWEVARSVRDWAETTGCWPWLRPSPMRPAGRSELAPRPDRRARREKGGAR